MKTRIRQLTNGKWIIEVEFKKYLGIKKQWKAIVVDPFGQVIEIPIPYRFCSFFNTKEDAEHNLKHYLSINGI